MTQYSTGVIRRGLAAHPLAVDIVITVAYLFGVLIGVAIDVVFSSASAGFFEGTPQIPGYLSWPWWPLAILRVLAVAAALLFRRRYPLQGLIVVALASVLDHGVQGFATAVALLFLLYAVPVYRSVAAGWIGYGIAIAASFATYLLEGHVSLSALDAAAAEASPIRSAGELIGLMLMVAIWYLVILMIGINLGNRRRYISAIIDRAHQLARERDQRAQLAVAEERSRIAREMHDIVAHSVSVMIALSEGASRVVTSAPESAADAMARSAETGRTALAEMRRLLGALNDPANVAPELAPQPGVVDIPDLVASFRDAGLQVHLILTGTSAGDRGQDLAVYRVVQEGLTNVLRYAGPQARVDVEVRRSPTQTVMVVRDYGAVGTAQPPASGLGSGRGLAGLRERTRMFGGMFESGPAPDGVGWLLRAELPVSADARERQGE